MEAFDHIREAKKVERIGWVVLALPMFSIPVLLLYALIAWYRVGHFPYYGQPDPKDMGFGVIEGLIWSYVLWSPWIWFETTLASSVLLLITGIKRKTLLRNMAIALLLHAFFFWFMIGDPLGVTKWIAD